MCSSAAETFVQPLMSSRMAAVRRRLFGCYECHGVDSVEKVDATLSGVHPSKGPSRPKTDLADGRDQIPVAVMWWLRSTVGIEATLWAKNWGELRRSRLYRLVDARKPSI